MKKLCKCFKSETFVLCISFAKFTLITVYLSHVLFPNFIDYGENFKLNVDELCSTSKFLETYGKSLEEYRTFNKLFNTVSLVSKFLKRLKVRIPWFNQLRS